MKKIITYIIASMFATASVAQNTQSMYIDYGATNMDDLSYVFRFSSNYGNSDSAVSFAAVTLGELIGYTDPSDVLNSWIDSSYLNFLSGYPAGVVITIDSIFAAVTHENNSANMDYITMSINSVNGIGTPTATVLWSQVDSTDVGLSPGGNWTGTGAAVVLSYTPGYTTLPGKKVALVLKYNDPSKLDTFAISGSSVDDGSGNGTTAEPSHYPYSYMKYPPFITGTTKNSTVGYGTFPFANYYEAQNWNIWASVTVALNVGVDEPFINELKLGQNAPNPFSKTSAVAYELQKGGNVSFEIRDITGKIISVINEGKQLAGVHTARLNAENLSPGFYFYTLNVNGKELTKKFNVVK